MEPRSLRTRRQLQAESIVNKLTHKSARSATGRSKRLKKPANKPTARKPSFDSAKSEDYLTYRDSKGELKKVRFVIQPTEDHLAGNKDNTRDENINISEMFLRTYKQLVHNKIITDDFYKNAAYDREHDAILLFNEDKDDYFEVYNGDKGVENGKGLGHDLMKPDDFKALVEEYQLNNLYC